MPEKLARSVVVTPCCRHHSLTERPLLRHSWICVAHSCSSARCFNSALVILTPHNTTVAKPFATFRYYCLMCVYARLGLTVTPFRLTARCQKGLLHQVLRKMPVPYATICKPDHGIRVLKHQMMDVLSLLLIHTIPSFAKSHQKISCHAINSRQLIYLNWWLSPCSIIVLHTDRHNLTCSGAASFNMLANSTEMLTSG